MVNVEVIIYIASYLREFYFLRFGKVNQVMEMFAVRSLRLVGEHFTEQLHALLFF